MKLLVDMNLTPRWVKFLSGLGWEAEHWSNVGDPKASDRFITHWAREKGWAVLTNDLNFP